MNKKSLALIFFAILASYTVHTALFSQSQSQSLFIGTIQFPASIQKVPGIRIYCSGHKITCETNDETKQLLFSIPEINDSKKNFLLITEALQFEVEENTVKYIKTAHKTPYKLYSLELRKLVLHTGEEIVNENERDGARLHMAEPETTYSWLVEEAQLDSTTGKVPDNTIIVCYTPDYIDHLEGGTSIELPRIIIKENLLEIAGSEQNLHDSATRLLLSVIDYDTLHKKIELEVKNDHQHNKTIIACRTR